MLRTASWLCFDRRALPQRNSSTCSALPAEQVEAILDARVVQFRARDLDALAAVLGTDVYTLFLPADAPLEVVPFQKIEQGRSRHPSVIVTSAVVAPVRSILHGFPGDLQDQGYVFGQHEQFRGDAS